MRPFDSAYDRDFAMATTNLLNALRDAGYDVVTPVTGSVIINDTEIKPGDWDDYAIAYGAGDMGLNEMLEEIGCPRYRIRPTGFVQMQAEDQLVQRIGPISRDVCNTGPEIQTTLDNYVYADYFQITLGQLYPTRAVAQAAAEAAYLGPDKHGVGVQWEIEEAS